MKDMVITYRGTIYPWHCDHMGHMNVMWYAGKFDEASWHFLSALGLTRTFLKERNRGLAALQQNTTYRRELRAGDIVTIRSGIREVKEKIIRFFHQMINDETGEVAAVTMLTGVYMDLAMRKSCQLPEEIIERGRALVDSAASGCDFPNGSVADHPAYPADPAVPSGDYVG